MPGADITKRLLAQALKECMKTKPLSKVSIQCITDQCGLNRNSFYYHFDDKYSLLNWTFYTEFTAVTDAEDYATPWEQLRQVSEYFYQNKEFYYAALQKQDDNSFVEYFHDVMRDSLMKHSAKKYLDSKDRDFFATFYADALTACTLRWLSEGAKYKPEEITQLVRAAMSGASRLDEKYPPENST